MLYRSGYTIVGSGFDVSNLLYEEVNVKPVAVLKSIANYTLNSKKLPNIKELLDMAKDKYEVIVLDSGGFQSKVGKLHKGNINKHIDFYYRLLEEIKNYDNIFLFSLDFPPCQPAKFHSDAITPEESGKYTLETYSHIAKYGDKKKTIIVTHFANSIVFNGWYSIFEQLQDYLRDFEYFATGVLVSHKNTPVISYYTAAKKFLELFNIKPKKFHFLGTASIPLLYPLYKDKSLAIKTYDKSPTGYFLRIPVPIKMKNNMIKITNLDLKSLDFAIVKQSCKLLEEYNYNCSILDVFKNIKVNYQERVVTKELVKYDILIMTLIGKWLEENRLIINNLDYNLMSDEKYRDTNLTKDQLYDIIKKYFDLYQM